MFFLSHLPIFRILGRAVLFTVFSGSAAICSSQQEDEKPAGAAFSGTIVDRETHPVTDAEIELMGNGFFRSKTNAQGKFEFLDSIPAGEYRIRIKSTRWLGITDYRDLPRIAIAANQAASRDFTLDRACRIKVTVVDEADQPVAASLYYQALGSERSSNAESVRANADGVAMIGGLSAKESKYRVGVYSQNHAFAQAVVAVSDPDEIVEKKIVLLPGREVRGTILCNDGEPPAGWRLHALPTWWNFGIYPSGVTIAEDGSFALPHIGNDQHDLTLFIPSGNGMSTSRPVLSKVNLSEMEQPIRATVDYPSPKSMNYLTGTIRWIGKPLESGVRISGYSDNPTHYLSFHLKPTEKDFKIGPVPAGTYRICVDQSEVETINLRKIKNLDDLEHVKIPNEKPLQLVLRVRGKPKVQGHVVDAKTQEPVQKFQYRIAKLATLSGPNYVQSDEWQLGSAGQFESEVVGPGIYSVSILADGFAVQVSPHVNTDEQPEEVLRFEMQPDVPLRGRVLDQGGNPVEGATVRALSLSSGGMPRVLDRFTTMQGVVQTQAGEFVLRNLGPGKETIRIDHPDFAFQTVEGVEVADDASPLTIHLSEGATIRGTVFDSQGKPQSDQTLLFQDNYAYGGNDREAGTFGKTITGENGEYEMRHLPETTVYVSRLDEWSNSGMVRQTLRTTDGLVHQVDMGGTTVLSGQLFLNDQPANSVRLHLGGSDPLFGGMKMYAETNPEGIFHFHGAPAGCWTLYRALDPQGRKWCKMRELEIPAGDGLQLGEIHLRVGELSVKCIPEGGSLPENLRLDLRQYAPQAYFGRSVAELLPQQEPNIFRFTNVSPGDYELVCYGAGGGSIHQRLELTEDQIDSQIQLTVPLGQETLSLNLQDENGKSVDANVTLVSEDGRQVVTVYHQAENKKGSHILKDLPVGKYSIRSGNIRNAPEVATVAVKAGVQNATTVTLDSKAKSNTGMARLRIYDEQGVFVPCRIHFTDEAAEVTQQLHASENYLSGAPGIYTIEVNHPGFQVLRSQLEIKAVDSNNQRSPDEFVAELRLSRRP